MNEPNCSQILTSWDDMQCPNAPFDIYEGKFTLQGEYKGESIEIEVVGSITYKWIPQRGVCFEGYTTFEPPVVGFKCDVVIGDNHIGTAFCCDSHTSIKKNEYSCIISDIISGIMLNVVYGDKTAKVTSIAFSLPNFYNFIGDVVKYKNDDSYGVASNRLLLEDEDYCIIIDKKFNYEKLSSSLKATGGYLFVCDGLITKKTGELISHEEINNNGIIEALTCYLTFLNGRRTAPCMLRGLYDGKVKWTDYHANSPIEPNVLNTHRWKSHREIIGLKELWGNFFALWKEDRNFLEFAIHWLTESLNNGNYVESNLVSIQNALELVFNWYIVERLEIIIGKDSFSMSASNKIRLLLSRLNISNKVPESLNGLVNFVTNNKDINDGPDAITFIRNAIVHGNEAKRKKLNEIDTKIKYDALQLGIEYCILSLLRILEYNGQYLSACDKEPKVLPWNNQSNKMP